MKIISWIKKTVSEFFGESYEKDKDISVTEWIGDCIEKVFALIKKDKAPPSENTIKIYKTSLGKLNAFHEYKNT
ncbi:hypothetical protein [Bacteroidetes bacterium endosymbiont of Geopemphigus sp.]|uniref:hypothetical protein n=1 Tax=Bacteroidetes bacterium endosymbiont of Geopemphigus sp. TaxID=2047937 RepID=UPI000CD0D520|nr:hypothetical protein [Bacteroidetes bacterium endosymbiont of Geopemphigus sp.]